MALESETWVWVSILFLLWVCDFSKSLSPSESKFFPQVKTEIRPFPAHPCVFFWVKWSRPVKIHCQLQIVSCKVRYCWTNNRGGSLYANERFPKKLHKSNSSQCFKLVCYLKTPTVNVLEKVKSFLMWTVILLSSFLPYFLLSFLPSFLPSFIS